MSDSDVLGAAGLAGKREPLALALARLFAGDNSASREIVWILAEFAWKRANEQGVALRRTEATKIAQAALAWHRDGVCIGCDGIGYQLILGTRRLSGVACQDCGGTTKRPFGREFKASHRPFADQVLVMLDRELGRAGPALNAKVS